MLIHLHPLHNAHHLLPFFEEKGAPLPVPREETFAEERLPADEDDISAGEQLEKGGPSGASPIGLVR